MRGWLRFLCCVVLGCGPLACGGGGDGNGGAVDSGEITSDAGEDAAVVVDDTPPRVTTTTPADGADGVAVTTDVQAEFSEAIDSSTVTAMTFRLSSGGENVAGEISADGKTASFHPSAALLEGKTYKATLTGDIKDVAGNALEQAKMWSFTTASDVPTVTITPADGATGIGGLASITLQFSEAVDESSAISPDNFVVEVGGTPFAGMRDYDASKHQVLFTPSAHYPAGGTVEITLDGITDTSGIAIDGPITSSFEVAAAPQVASHTPADADIDVALEDGVAVTFSTTMDHTTLDASSLFIEDPSAAGVAIPAHYAVHDGGGKTAVTITPDDPLVESTQYRVVVTTAAESSKNIPLADEVTFTFTTVGVPPTVASTAPSDAQEDVAVGPADLANGGAIRIQFGEAMDVSTFADNVVVFDGANLAKRENRVAGTVSADGSDTLVFTPDEPLLEAHTYWVVVEGQDGSAGGVTDAFGNAMVDDLIFSFTTETLPAITLVEPQNGSSAVSRSANLIILFNKPIETASVAITPLSGTPRGAVTILDQNGNGVFGQVQTTAASSSAIVIHRFASGAVADWDANTRYTVDIDGALSGASITDEHGHAVSSHRIVRFTTGSGNDTTPPDLACATCASPHDGDQVGRSIGLWAEFNEQLDASTVSSQTVKLYEQGAPTHLIAANVSYDATTRRVLLEPVDLLPAGANLTFELTTGLKDLSGNAKAGTNSIDFNVTDNAPPAVSSTFPQDGATDVALNQGVRIVFSEDVDPATLDVSAAASSAIAGSVDYDSASHTAVFRPDAEYAANTEFTVTVGAAVQDLDGESMAAPYTFSFTTSATVTTLDEQRPAIAATDPGDGASGVASTTDIVVEFDEPMDPTTISGAAIELMDTTSGRYEDFDYHYDVDNERLVLSPRWALAGGDAYSVTLAPSISDQAGNMLQDSSGANSFGFSIESERPTASSSLAGATVGAAIQIPVVFSEQMNADSISPATVAMSGATAGDILVALDYQPGTRTLVLEPVGALADDTYTVHLAADATDPGASIRDVAGNVLQPTGASERTFSFTVNTQAPNVAAFLPACNSVIAVDELDSTTFSIQFDRAVTGPSSASLTNNASAFTLSGSQSGSEALAVTQTAADTVTVVASNGLGDGETYTLSVVHSQIESEANATAMAADRACTFTTQKIVYQSQATSCTGLTTTSADANDWGCRVVPGSNDATEVWQGGNSVPPNDYVRDCPNSIPYPNGATRVVTLTTPTIDLSGLSTSMLSFSVSDDVNGSAGDFGRLEVLQGGVAQSPPLVTWSGHNFGTFRTETYDLSAYASKVIQLRFTLSIAGGPGGLTTHNCPSTGKGVLVDDLLLVGN